MGDTKVQGAAKADEVITGIYSVYIDENNRPDGFTVRNGQSGATDRNDRNRDVPACNLFDLPRFNDINVPKSKLMEDSGSFKGGLIYKGIDETKYQLTPKPGLDLEPDPKWRMGIFAPVFPIGKCSENFMENSFELASGKPLNESVFKNASGEEFKVGSGVWISDGKIDMDGFGSVGKMNMGGIGIEFSIGPAFPCHRSPDGPWKVTGFKIAGFTDDPERKRTDNMSKIPDEKRKYAVIDVELVSTDRVASYKKDYLKCAPDGTCETTPVYETRTVALDSLGKNKDIMKKEDYSGKSDWLIEPKFRMVWPWKF